MPQQVMQPRLLASMLERAVGGPAEESEEESAIEMEHGKKPTMHPAVLDRMALHNSTRPKQPLSWA